MRNALFLALLASSRLFQVGLAQDPSWPTAVRPLFESYCLDCHQGDDAAGELNLDQLGVDLNDVELSRKWTLIHDRLASGEMPPPDESQPTTDERRKLIAAIAAAITNADGSRADVVLRRLNRAEYENTVRDLFGVEVQVKELLPEDTPTAGFDNVGEGLAVSAEAIQAYLHAADVTLDAVFGPPKKPQHIVHETNLLDQLTWDGKPQLAAQIGKMFRKTDDGLVIFQSGYCPTNLVNFLGFARPQAPIGARCVCGQSRARNR